MSRIIQISKFSREERKKILDDVEVILKKGDGMYKKYIYIYPIECDDEFGYIPFSYDLKLKRPKRNIFPNTNIEFNGILRTEQKNVKNDTLSYLNKTGSCIISAYCGFGKTALSIYLATRIKLKTLIITHRIVLINQWKESIQYFCPNAKIQILKTKSDMNYDADFYIMNASNVFKKDATYFKTIGFLVVDELHCIMAEGMYKSMTRIVPRYLLGLSATPFREDGLDKLIRLYFGGNRISRQLNRLHYVYKVKTGFVPNVERQQNGKVNWNSILDSQSNDNTRTELIITIVKQFKDRIFLILCKRVNQANILLNRLKDEGESVSSLIGKQQTFEYDCRILIGISSKVGTGFSHKRLDTLLLASDIKAYFIQYLGRVFRREDVIPFIFDLVDTNSILENHYRFRKKVYLKHGGKILDFHKTFPNVLN